MMMDRRHLKRQFVFKHGKIILSTGDLEVDCAILNFSESGAGLTLPRNVDVPDHFTLLDVATDRRYLTQVIWRRGRRIGVLFDDLADYD